jgi:hypothetical protein
LSLETGIKASNRVEMFVFDFFDFFAKISSPLSAVFRFRSKRRSCPASPTKQRRTMSFSIAGDDFDDFFDIFGVADGRAAEF